MASPPPTAFDTLVQQIGTLPLWVKQVIYAQLRHDLESTMSKSTMEAFGPEHTVQLWVPELTRNGVAELEKPTGQADQSVLRILYLAQQHRNVQAIEKHLIVPPRSSIIMATIHYLAGRTRLGEYLVKINRVSIEQLDQALRTQKYIEESMGDRTGIANVLINLGYIKKEDSEGILFLKQESRKAFEGLQITQPPASNEALHRLQGQLQQALQRIRELETQNYQLQQKKP